MSQVDIIIDHSDYTYNADQHSSITGKLVITTDKPIMEHRGITVRLHGSVEHTVPAKQHSLMDSILNNIKPTIICNIEHKVAPEGKIQFSDARVLHDTRSISNQLAANDLTVRSTSTGSQSTVSQLQGVSNSMHPMMRLQQQLDAQRQHKTLNNELTVRASINKSASNNNITSILNGASDLTTRSSSPFVDTDSGYGSSDSLGSRDGSVSITNTLSLSRANSRGRTGAAVLQYRHELPFTLPLKAQGGTCNTLYDTYHGVYTNVAYHVSAEIPRGRLNRTLKARKEVYVQSPSIASDPSIKHEASRSHRFSVAPHSLQNVQEASRKKIPDFIFDGVFERTTCNLNEPLYGELMVRKSAIEISSIELQLVRVESYTYGRDKELREATEIMTQQIADGHPMHHLSIPIYLLFPKYATCSTIIHPQHKVEFELNVVILFSEGYMITENFALRLYR